MWPDLKSPFSPGNYARALEVSRRSSPAGLVLSSHGRSPWLAEILILGSTEHLWVLSCSSTGFPHQDQSLEQEMPLRKGCCSWRSRGRQQRVFADDVAWDLRWEPEMFDLRHKTKEQPEVEGPPRTTETNSSPCSGHPPRIPFCAPLLERSRE